MHKDNSYANQEDNLMMNVLSRYLNRRRIEQLLKQINISPQNYKIDVNNQVSISGDIFISPKMVKNNALIIQFKEVTGNFSARGLELMTLQGCPKVVGGNFTCAYNYLEHLKGGPEKVGGTFDCSNNNLIHLQFGPKEVGENYICEDNDLVSLDYLPQSVGKTIYLHMIEAPIEPYRQVFEYHSYFWQYQGTLDNLISQR